MDLLKDISARIDALPGGSERSGLRDVLTHLEVASRLLEYGTTLPDDAFFTDVIYRANHAFEGALKEAYEVLAEQNSAGKSPFQIEQYLEKENILRDLVLDQFRNYRQKWRNPSTHDHRLFFKEEEAFLALASVAAFLRILLTQMAVALGYRAEKAILEKQPPPPSSDAVGLAKVVETLLLEFARTYQPMSSNKALRESDIIGSLQAFLENRAPTLHWEQQVALPNGGRPDFFVKGPTETAVIEVKRSLIGKRALADGVEQIKYYMRSANTKIGALLVAPFSPRHKINAETVITPDGIAIIIAPAFEDEQLT